MKCHQTECQQKEESVDKMSVDEMSIDNILKYKMIGDIFTVSKIPIDKMP